MSGTSTEKYVILLHVSGKGYGVHFRNGQIISGYPTLEQAERAMARLVVRDKRVEAARRARSIVRIMK